MKTKLILICLTTCLYRQLQAQDTLVFKTGRTVMAKVITITNEFITYKKYESPEGPSYIAAAREIQLIKYENGFTESIESQAPESDRKSPASTYAKFGGPRVGCTFIGDGTAANYIVGKGGHPIVVQFGWQFETRIFTSNSGISGLVEFVPLVGGVEQGLFLPSMSVLFGVRGKNGAEFAMGPNLSLSGMGMVFAAGTSFHIDDVYFPVNLAIVPSVSSKKSEYNPKTNKTEEVTLETGIRVSLLVGFNVRKN